MNSTTTSTTTYPATSVITGPKAFHRQGNYHNWLHNLFSFTMPLLGIATAIAALVTVIVGTVKLGNNAEDIFETVSGRLLMDTNANMALWIINAALLPAVILSGILAFVFSRIAKRYEKGLAKHNNDANVGEQRKRRAWIVGRWGALIPCFLNELLQVALMGFFIATVVVSSFRHFQWRSVNTFFGACPPQTTAGQCDSIGDGYDILLAGTILSLCSVVPLLILNSMALSHLGSRENKVNEFPAQQVTQVTTQPSVTSVV